MREGEKSENLFLIKEGIIDLQKSLNYLGSIRDDLKPKVKLPQNLVVLNLGRGDMYGEDSYFHRSGSTYSL
jgi:hypothetical protein